MRLAGKGAVVTGAAKGIGLAICEAFVREGARVLMADVDAMELRAAADRLGQPAMEADVSSRPQVEAMIARSVEAFGAVDILVNNAGVTWNAPFLDLTDDDFERVLRVNLKSAFMATQAAGRRMAERGSGVIINMSSVNALLAIPNQAAYAVSKGGLRQLTNVSALALASYGIRVNAIGPGTIMTDLARTILTDPEAEAQILSRTPLQRFGTPEEVASVAVFLASEESAYITGQTIYPDGGRLGLNYTVPVRTA